VKQRHNSVEVSDQLEPYYSNFRRNLRFVTLLTHFTSL